MAFGVWGVVGPSNHVLDGGPDPFDQCINTNRVLYLKLDAYTLSVNYMYGYNFTNGGLIS